MRKSLYNSKININIDIQHFWVSLINFRLIFKSNLGLNKNKKGVILMLFEIELFIGAILYSIFGH